MEWLNYHHLLYFYLVAREGTIARASKLLSLSQPTISGQIRALEESIGEKLFVREGRVLVLTDVGHLVYRYADEIFMTGRELQSALKGRPTARPHRLLVGVADTMPKLMAQTILEPALEMPNVQLVCSSGSTARLLDELTIRNLDLVLSDAPIGPVPRAKAYDHLLGECGITVFATANLAATLRDRFPYSLDGAPMLLPNESAVLRRSLDRYFSSIDARPRVVAEFEDSSLMKVFGEHGGGAFVGPTTVEEAIRDHYSVEIVGRLPEVRERFYAITVERRIGHKAVIQLATRARERVFDQGGAAAKV